MSLMTHTHVMPLRARGDAGEKAGTLTLGSSHVAMIKRFAKFAAMMTGFFLLMVAVMSVKYAAFFLQMPR